MAGADPQDDGTLLGALADPRPPRPATTDVTPEANDPAESGPTLGETSLGCSPTPEIPLAEPSRTPLLASEAPTESTRRSEPIRRTSDRLDEPSGAAFGPHFGPESTRQPPAPTVRPHLRRNESVIQEAARFRASPIHQLTLVAARLRSGSGAVGRTVAATVTDWSATALRRFERLPRWQQAGWVAAPYAGAIGLVGYLFFARPDPVAVVADASATRWAAAVEKTETEEPAHPGARAPSRRTADGGLSTRRVRLAVPSALFIRPDPTVFRSARLRAGHRVTVFPEFPTPEGWMLARSEKGTIGFISTLHLAGERDPSYDRAARARRRQRRRHRSR